jgi:uncharacterized protein
LATLTDNEEYRRQATTVLRLVADAMTRYPAGFGRALGALDFYLSSPKEIAIVGDLGSQATVALRREIWRRYLPNKVVAMTQPDSGRAAELLPLVRDRGTVDGQPTAFVCVHYSCKTPVTDPAELAAQLEEMPEKQGRGAAT